jgi:putative spermidine/putrescine transport system substrate-binding protein
MKLKALAARTRVVTNSASALAGCLGIVAAATWSTAALGQDECKEMQVYLTIAPNHREDVMSYIAPRLKERFGVELVAEAIGNAMMTDRLAAQGDNPRVSVVQWDVPIGRTACDEGKCAPIDLTKAPNAAKLPDWAVLADQAGKTVILTAGVLGVGFLYNEAELSKNNIPPPQSWNDLKDPIYAGRLGITAPQSTLGTAALVMLAKANGGGEANIDPGFIESQKIVAKNTIFTWSSEMSNLFQLGEIWLAVSSSTVASSLKANGLPIKFVLPKEGAPTVNTGMSLIKGAPCQEAAHEYVNEYFSPEFQAMRLASGSLTALAEAWPLAPPKVEGELGMGAKDIDKFVDLDWRAINAARPAWLERWSREIR